MSIVRVTSAPDQRHAAARVRAYIAAQPPLARRALRTLRAAIRAAAPRATEHFSYRMPAFQLGRRAFVWYAAFRDHVSLYPMTAEIRQAHAAALRGFRTSQATVQFPLDRPVPVALVRRLVQARAAAVRREARTDA
jgi:uncharacterized protein YdhG (YjbR/CyaY superfamily)